MPPVSRVPAGQMLDAMADRHPWWFPQGAKGLAWDYFVYGTDFLPLGAAGSATAALTNPININSDSAFLIVSGALVETDTANTTFLAQRPLLCSLQEGGSGRTLNNTPIHVDNWFGTAELPKIWEQPKLLVPNSTFNVTLTNLEATARNIRIAFHGFKLFGFVP